jgi:5-methylcytosine-specific restriction protein A
MADGKRAFRGVESFEAEALTRDLISPFLEARGLSDLDDHRDRVGKDGQSQIIKATDFDGHPICIRVKICWTWANNRAPKRNYSASQLAARMHGDWVTGFDSLMERQKKAGITHYLIVQGDDTSIQLGALIPIAAVRPIWEQQREVSQRLIDAGKLKGQKKNHAENGGSPTLYLMDLRRAAAKEVTDVLWDWPGVIDLMRMQVTVAPADDSVDDMPVDYSMYGSDKAPRVKTQSSGVKRDPRVRRAVVRRATEGCERQGCEDTRTYPGFLDVHHILGAGKSDRVWNCVALCPNCHREAHYSPEADRINAALYEYAKQFEPSYVKLAQRDSSEAKTAAVILQR